MKKTNLKSFQYVLDIPTDIFDGIIDILVTLENDDIEYWIEVGTPQAFSSHMEETKRTCVEPGPPYIIVKDLPPGVIRAALEEYLRDQEDAFWIKFYSVMNDMNRDDLEEILDRQKKRLYEEEED